MKLAVYARSLTRRSTGRGMMARNMLMALRRVDPGIEVHLFAQESPEPEAISLHPALGTGWAGDLWRLCRGTAREIAALQPDVLWSATHVLPAGLPESLPRVITVLDVVWRDLPETMRWGNRMACRWSEKNLEKADAIACISEFTRDRVLSHWPETASRAHVMELAPNPRLRPVDGATEVVRTRFGISGPYFLSVGTVEPRKDLASALDAMEFLPEVLFVHCGSDGWKSAATLRRMRQMRNVRRLGHVSEDDLSALYAGAKAAVFPSLYEGFHLPVLDAAALGCPVAASDIPAHREVMGNAAVYFPPKDPAALADVLRGLFGTEERRNAAGREGRERARAFDWARSARRLLELLRQAAG